VGNGTVTWKITQSVEGTANFSLRNLLQRAWLGTTTGTTALDISYTTSAFGCTSNATISSRGDLVSDTELPLADTWLQLDPWGDTYNIVLPTGHATATVKRTSNCGLSFEGKDRGMWLNPVGSVEIDLKKIGNAFPPTGYVLQGSRILTTVLGDTEAGDVTIEHEFRWSLEPTGIDELEVVIDPDGYDSWRPEGAELGTSAIPANDIKVRATLQNSDGSAPDVKAVRWTFELIGTSRMPGTAMNFPLASTDTEYDLQFIESSNPTFDEISADGQHAVWYGEESTSSAVVVSSLDWGAWSAIRVTAELTDGRKVVGHLRGDRSYRDVRLPKRSPDSRIADVWKHTKGATGPDTEDKEHDPVGLPGADGDGFTLYEEYRGFYENAHHVEGNPTRKDLFILNMVGARAEPGIWVFTSITGLEVHKDLTAKEIDLRARPPER
jgi:hypothetical protein